MKNIIPIILKIGLVLFVMLSFLSEVSCKTNVFEPNEPIIEDSGNPVNACGGCRDISTVADIDGNIYTVVQIGEQCWMVENLKTIKYADGTPIPNVTSNDKWITLSSGAWCNYENSLVNGQVYGKLYNWFAVVDERNVCPDKWHVPSDAEWTQLELALGMLTSEASLSGWRGSSARIGVQMKALELWQSPNIGATNSSGFSCLPSGNRGNTDGSFDSLISGGYWWSSTAFDDSLAWTRYLHYNHLGSYRYYYNKQVGRSVRCVRDLLG